MSVTGHVARAVSWARVADAGSRVMAEDLTTCGGGGSLGYPHPVHTSSRHNIVFTCNCVGLINDDKNLRLFKVIDVHHSRTQKK